MIPVIICGLGKMGKAVALLAVRSEGMDIFGVIEAPDYPFVNREAINLIGGDTSSHPDVWVEIGWNNTWESSNPFVATSFAIPSATMLHAKMCYKNNVALVAGTTGLNVEQLNELKKYAKKIPIVYDTNFSLGINAMNKVLFELARLLPDWDVEIMEKHHNQKKDAPSGTAIRLAKTVAEARVQKLDMVVITRFDNIARRSGQIGVQALRAGDIIGDHEITIAGAGQRIELNHRAHSRDNFASGVIEAIRWVVGKPAGFYNMQNVLGLR